MGFSQEREIVEIRNQNEFEELDEFEDLELHIKGAVSVKDDIEITDCNIIFGSGCKMELKGGKVEFNDCEIAFPGDINTSVITANGGDIAFDSCNIYQLESSGNEKNAFIFSDVNQKTIEISNCKIHDINGVFVQSNGTNVYVDKTEVYNFAGSLINIQKGTKGFSPAFELLESSFKDCSSSNARRECLIIIGHIMSGKVENCNFNDCQTGCIYANGNRWDDDNDGKDSKDCPFIINKCTFKKCKGKPVHIYLYNTKITNCEFYQCEGLEAKTQLSELYIENCEFKECKSESPRDGVLSILVDVYEKWIYIKNCEFEKCEVDRETRYDEGIIFLTSGFADKDQRETVTIEKCSFRSCIGNQIRGIERDGGFFGKSVKLYVRK